MKRWAIPGGGVLILIGLLAWREWMHAENRSRWQAEAKGLEVELSALTANLEKQEAALNASESALGTLQMDLSALRDRATNLEAQRNHLRAETDRQSERAREAEQAIVDIRTQLEGARQNVLELSALPRQLRAELIQAQARVEELEASMDRQAGRQSIFPAALNVEGLATDGSVFALKGTLPDFATLPMPVYLCQQDSIRLEGWINRLENGVAIGHVEHWRVPVSTLVKGQKVFILPR